MPEPAGHGSEGAGIAAPESLVGRGSVTSAHGSMNHVAFDVPAERIEEYRERLLAKGVEVTEVFNHDDSPAQISAEVTDDVFIRSIYFVDPDGILLEFASWTKEFGPEDAKHTPATEADRDRYLETQARALKALRAS